MSYPHPLYRNALFETQPHRSRTVQMPKPMPHGMWLPHHALLADATWIDGIVDAFTKVRTASDSLARA